MGWLQPNYLQNFFSSSVKQVPGSRDLLFSFIIFGIDYLSNFNRDSCSGFHPTVHLECWTLSLAKPKASLSITPSQFIAIIITTGVLSSTFLLAMYLTVKSVLGVRRNKRVKSEKRFVLSVQLPEKWRCDKDIRILCVSLGLVEEADMWLMDRVGQCALTGSALREQGVVQGFEPTDSVSLERDQRTRWQARSFLVWISILSEVCPSELPGTFQLHHGRHDLKCFALTSHT